jgi:L-alanine-DL-glutamate epimerase-like enolase superfamily enzyme
MKISRIVDLHADAGWRVFSFLKIETDAGLVGWSEYNESYGSKGLTAVIMKLAEGLIGQDPRPVEGITANLYARTRQAPGGPYPAGDRGDRERARRREGKSPWRASI